MRAEAGEGREGAGGEAPKERCVMQSNSSNGSKTARSCEKRCWTRRELLDIGWLGWLHASYV